MRVQAPSDGNGGNALLAKDRAASVRDYLVGRGIAAPRSPSVAAGQAATVEIVLIDVAQPSAVVLYQQKLPLRTSARAGVPPRQCPGMPPACLAIRSIDKECDMAARNGESKGRGTKAVADQVVAHAGGSVLGQQRIAAVAVRRCLYPQPRRLPALVGGQAVESTAASAGLTTARPLSNEKRNGTSMRKLPSGCMSNTTGVPRNRSASRRC